jgi:phosphoribosyl 1,2-cyclic phosphate phosphodiesterase
MVDDVLQIDFSYDALHYVLTQNVDFSRLKYMIYTHGHDDHFQPSELQYLSWMFVKCPREDRLQIFAPHDVCDAIAKQIDTKDVPIETKSLHMWDKQRFGNYTVIPIQAQHDPGHVCFNYLLNDGKSTLLYATDTGWYETPTWNYLERTHIDGIVVECTKGPIEGGYMAHLSISQLIELRQRLISKGVMSADAPVVTTHHSHLCGLLHEELEELLNPHGIQVGYDGMVFEIGGSDGRGVGTV